MTRPSPQKDPRRALGVRAGPTPILPKLNVEDHDEPSGVVSTPYPTPPDSYLSTSHDPFAVHQAGPSAPTKVPTDRGAIETRKLLSHVLTKLEQRDSCPDLLEMAISAGRRADGRHKGKAKAVMDQVMVITHTQDLGEDHEQEDSDQGWSNEATCDLVEQLRSLLVLAERQGLRLFDGDTTPDPFEDKSQRKSRAGRFSSLASPTSKRHSDERQVVVRQTLLERTITIIRAMLLDESLHRTIRFRLFRPPHALQTFCLDIASCLFAQCDRSVKRRILDAVVDSLAAVLDRDLAGRYCAWIERHLKNVASSHPPNYDWHILIPKLLSTLSSILDDRRNISFLHQAHRLLSVCTAYKSDLVNDLLSVIASGPPDARRTATSLLATFYPRFVGHNSISANLRDMSYAAQIQDSDGPARSYAPHHHYLLWRCDPESQGQCRVCQVPVEGAGLMCTLCKDVCHSHCMDIRADAFHYEAIYLSETEDRQEAVTVRFSRCLKSTVELSVDPPPAEHPTCLSRGNHDLHLVNLVDLSLCWHCRQPLWGSLAQAYACLGGCQQLYHPGCVATITRDERCSPPGGYIIDEVWSGGGDPFTILASTLQAALDDHLGTTLTSGRTFDDLAVAYGVLWTQYHLYKNGVASGSIRVIDESGKTAIDAVPFRKMLKDLERRLKDIKRPQDSRDGRSYLFDQSFLRHCGERIQSPRQDGGSGEAIIHSVQQQLGITSDQLARYLCNHLLACGVVSANGPDSPIRPVQMENVAGAIHSLLDDLDLSANEIGMRLLMDKAWPSSTQSLDLMDTIGRSVLAWVMTMGEKLHQVVREYASRQRPPPGVSSSDSSVATYKAAQYSLLVKFVQPWLAALQNLDAASFVDMAYHVATESAKTDASIVIEKITILADAGVIFGSTMDLLVSWLEDVSQSSAVDPRVLARFSREDSQGKSALADLWIKISLLSADSPETFANTCGWMRVLAATGLHIPLSTLSALTDPFPEATSAHVDLTVAIRTCQTPNDPEHLADLAIRICSRAASDLPHSAALVRESWALLSTIYGQPAQPQSRPKANKSVTEHVNLGPALVAAAVQILSSTDTLDQSVLDGLLLLLGERSLVKNVDAFIVQHCPPLYEELWYRLGSSKLVTELLYRLVSVNAEPMIEILTSESLDEDRILRFLLDLRGCPTVRPPTLALVSLLILSVNKLGRHCRSLLLPARMQVISDHIEANLLASSDEIRLEVMPKVLHLLATMSEWQVISLASVDMLLADVSATIERLSNATSAPSLAARSDAVALRRLLVIYGLIAYTREKKPNWHLCQRFVIHVSLAAATLESDNSGGFLTALTFALDSSTRINYSMDLAPTEQSVLVGAPYLPVALTLIREIGKAPDHQNQCRLLSLAMVVFSKHSFTGMELAALGALQSVAEYSSFPSDSRLLALQVLQVAYTTLSSSLIARVSPSLYLTLSDGSDDTPAVKDRVQVFMHKMVDQSSARFFIQTSVLGSDRFAKALRGTKQLDKALGYFPDVLKRDRNSLDQYTRMLQGLAGTQLTDTVDPVSSETIESVGSLLSRLARHVAEWDSSEFDPNPTLCFVAFVLARAPEDDKTTLSHQISTFLHLCIARFSIDPETVARLLEASSAFRSVLGIPTAGASPTTLLALFDHMITRVSPHTISPTVPSACLAALRMTSRDTDAETMVQMRLTAAQLLVLLEKTSAGSLRHQLATIPSQFVYLQIFLPLLMALSNPPSDTLTPLVPLLARVLAASFQQVRGMLSEQDLEGHGADILSQIFAILQVASTAPSVSALWLRIWPDWQELLRASLDPKCVNGPLRALVQSSFADFLVQANATDSVVVARFTEPIAGELHQLLASPARQSVRKLNKAASLRPALVGRPLDVESIRHGMITAEQMKVLRAM